MAMQHRTDCVNCGASIYHPPIDGPKDGPDAHSIHFISIRPQGRVFHHVPSQHHIVCSSGGLVVATCVEYWKLHETFEFIDRIATG